MAVSRIEAVLILENGLCKEAFYNLTLISIIGS